jgi:hypothetical protein
MSRAGAPAPFILEAPCLSGDTILAREVTIAAQGGAARPTREYTEDEA